MSGKKLLSIILLFGIINTNLIPAFAFGKREDKKPDKKFINAQISETKFDYINLAWWENFDDEILKGYILKALEQNQDLKIATLKVEEFNQLVKIQHAKELPSASISPGMGALKMANADGSGIFNFPLVVNYEADIFLKNKDKTKSAKKQYEASKDDEKAAYIAIASAVSGTYLNLVKIDKLIEIQNDIISYREQIYNLMIKRNKQGITSTADTIRANKELIWAQTDLIELEKSKTILSNKLCVLIGESPTNGMELKRIAYDDLKFKQEIPKEIPSAIIVKRPDVMKSEKQLEKAGIDVKIARKEFLPTFDILGLLVFSSSSLSGSFNWKNTLALFGGQTSLALFSGGQKTANLKMKKNIYEQLLQAYQKTNLTAIQEVNDSLSSLKLDDTKHTQNLEKLKMEQAELVYNEKRYAQGTISYLDLIQRKENLLAMNKVVTSTKIDCLIDYISLYKATGNQI